MKLMTGIFILLLIPLIVWANDDEKIIKYLDLFENYELLDDENYDELLNQEIEVKDE